MADERKQEEREDLTTRDRVSGEDVARANERDADSAPATAPREDRGGNEGENRAPGEDRSEKP